MKKVLITGASGFVGGYLAEYLLSLHDFEIQGTYHSDNSLEKSPIKEKISFVHLDLLDSDNVASLIQTLKPDWIFHLAAFAHVGKSFDSPSETIVNNVNSQLSLLEAVRKAELKNSKILIVGSAEEYGFVHPDKLPIDENTPLRPGNPYAVSKITQDFIGLQYHLAYGLDIIRVRPFNHTGPGRPEMYVESRFAKALAEIEKGKVEPILTVGNLEAKRDFTDVRDVIKAYTLLMEKGKAGEVYNVGSGISHKISEVLDMLSREITVKFDVEHDPSLLRPSDIPELRCNPTKLKQTTGWEPEIPLDKTLKDILDYWRENE